MSENTFFGQNFIFCKIHVSKDLPCDFELLTPLNLKVIMILVSDPPNFADFADIYVRFFRMTLQMCTVP